MAYKDNPKRVLGEDRPGRMQKFYISLTRTTGDRLYPDPLIPQTGYARMNSFLELPKDTDR
jgi:hypothetical protein